MSDDLLEVQDANIILVHEEPLAQVNLGNVLEREELASLFKKPFSVSQGLQVDATTGTPSNTYNIESMKSQRTITFTAVRIEVHERSGAINLDKAQLPKIAMTLAEALEINQFKAAGANWEITLKSLEIQPAYIAIGQQLLQSPSFLPDNMQLLGGGARLVIGDDDGVIYTVIIEPRGMDLTTNTVGVSCNANLSTAELPTLEQLESLFQGCHDLLFRVKDGLFPRQ